MKSTLFFPFLFSCLFLFSTSLWAGPVPSCVSSLNSLVNMFKTNRRELAEDFAVWSLNIGSGYFDLSDFGPGLGRFVFPLTKDDLIYLLGDLISPRVLILNSMDESIPSAEVDLYVTLLEGAKRLNSSLSFMAIGPAAEAILDTYMLTSRQASYGENFSITSNEDKAFFKGLFDEFKIKEDRNLKMQLLQTFSFLEELQGKKILCILTGSANSLALFIAATYYLGAENVYAIVSDTGLVDRIGHIESKLVLSKMPPSSLVQTFSFTHEVFRILESDLDLKAKKEEIYNYYTRETALRIIQLQKDYRIKIDYVLKPNISSIDGRGKDFKDQEAQGSEVDKGAKIVGIASDATTIGPGEVEKFIFFQEDKVTSKDVKKVLGQLDLKAAKIAQDLDIATVDVFKSFNAQGVKDLIEISQR